MAQIQPFASQAILLLHLMCFAFAISTILKEDIQLLFSTEIDTKSLHSTARFVTWLLAGLWITGIALILFDTVTDLATLMSKPKVVTKIIVVTLLTLNGILLHILVFPMLTSRSHASHIAASTAALFGAFSTASWLFASFVGAARHVAPHLTLTMFVALYGATVLLAVTVAMVFVRKHIITLLEKPVVDVPLDATTLPYNAGPNIEEALSLLARINSELRTIALQGSVDNGQPPLHSQPRWNGTAA